MIKKKSFFFADLSTTSEVPFCSLYWKEEQLTHEQFLQMLNTEEVHIAAVHLHQRVLTHTYTHSDVSVC